MRKIFDVAYSLMTSPIETPCVLHNKCQCNVLFTFIDDGTFLEVRSRPIQVRAQLITA